MGQRGARSAKSAWLGGVALKKRSSRLSEVQAQCLAVFLRTVKPHLQTVDRGG
jgi:hypothetical protein